MDDTDRKAYAHWLRESAGRYAVAIHAWVFMSNHVHLLVTPGSAGSISRFMQYLGRLYVRRFNDRHERTGTLFEGRFRSCIVDSRAYLLICQRYIELNPVRAGMVSDPAAYPWSSYRAHAFGRAAKLWSPHPQYLALGDTPAQRRAVYREFCSAQLSPKTIQAIRVALDQGLALGSDSFKDDLEQLTGQPQRLTRRGPQRGG